MLQITTVSAHLLHHLATWDLLLSVLMPCSGCLVKLPVCRAVKVNENNIQKSKTYTALALEHDPSLLDIFTTKVLLDNEVLLLQALDCDLLVFSAHTDTIPLLETMKHFEGMNKAVYEQHVDDAGKPVLGRIAWSVINDAYTCGVCNIEAPSTVAISCLLMAGKYLKVRYITVLMPEGSRLQLGHCGSW